MSKECTLVVRLDCDTKEALAERADRKGESLSVHARKIFDRAVKKKEPKVEEAAKSKYSRPSD